MTAPALPASPLPVSLVENPRLDRWIHFQPDRTVRIATGKVEIGQGVVTAIGQIAADELDVPLDRVAVLSGDTTHGPDELYTTSSLSIEVSGRIPWSETYVEPLTLNGRISRSNRPSSVARCASW